MVDREFPQVPVEHFDEKFHRRLLAQRANAALVLAVEDLADGQVPMWDGERWKNVGGFGTWTPTLAFGGASTGITYDTAASYATAGSYYRLANLVFVTGQLTLTNKGTATGSARIAGLPLSVSDSIPPNLDQMFSCPFASGMTGLSSVITGGVTDNDDQIALYGWSATQATQLDENNFTNVSRLIFQALYVTDAD